jgi:hypothetical protein
MAGYRDVIGQARARLRVDSAIVERQGDQFALLVQDHGSGWRIVKRAPSLKQLASWIQVNAAVAVNRVEGRRVAEGASRSG